MCSPTPCPRCSKTTWSGCGKHVEAVMANIPPAQRCTCEKPASEETGWKKLVKFLF